MSIYDYKVKDMKDQEISLADFKGKVVLIVNTASKCGFTPQFEGLEKLYDTYKDEDFVILGFPCNQFLRQDPAGNDQILEFCQVNYGVTFPMLGKIKVKGKEQEPLYKYLIEQTNGKSIKWNFTKFLVDQDGKISARFEPKETPEQIEPQLKELLKK